MRKLIYILFLILLFSLFTFGKSFQNISKDDIRRASEILMAKTPIVDNPFSNDILRFKIGEFSTDAPPEFNEIWTQLKKSSTSHTKYFIVQFRGKIKKSWRELILNNGGKIYGYIPQNGYIVYGNLNLKTTLLLNKNVRWIHLYDETFRIDPIIFQLQEDGIENLKVKITYFPEVNEEEVISFLKDKNCNVLKYKKFVKGKFNTILATIPLNNVVEIASFEGCMWIEPQFEYNLCNNIARSSDNISTGTPGGSGPLLNVEKVWEKGIHGEGIIVDQADVGLDTGNLSTLHKDFGDISSTTNPMRVVGEYALGRYNDWSDPDGHGTHVAGSVLGNGFNSGGNPANDNYPSTCYAGIAPKALLIIQSLMNEEGYLNGIPANLNDLFIDPYNDGARINISPWGAYAEGEYTTDSHNLDEFVWNHKDFLPIFPAGNDGFDGKRYVYTWWGWQCQSVSGTTVDGFIDPGYIESPGSAKNCITVGSTENYRPTAQFDDNGTCTSNFTYYDFNSCRYSTNPIKDDEMGDNASGMVAFSSRGPCKDNRIKPDVVAPGTYILSTRSQDPSAGTGWGVCGLDSTTATYYCYNGGASMSAALVAGVAALVRQYFTDGYYPSGAPNEEDSFNPSAALIKAVILNGAYDISPGQYSSPTEIPDPRPNSIEGWGRPDLYDSLYFYGDGKKLLVYDDTSYTLSTGDEKDFYIYVNSSSYPLKITLCWIDPPASLSSSQALVNDLDLEVVDPSGTTYYPNNSTSADRVNNVETVDILTPSTGMYTIKVKGYNVPGNGETDSDKQPFALVATGDIHWGTSCSPSISTPTNFSVSNTGLKSVFLMWDSSTNADHYIIFRKFGSCTSSYEYEKIGETSDTIYEDKKVEIGETYSYFIIATNSDESCYSGESSCETITVSGSCDTSPDFDGITSITQVSSNGCGFFIEWSPATSICSNENVTYDVYRSTSPNFEPTDENLIASCIPTTHYFDTNVDSNIPYYYLVKAEDHTNDGSGPCNGGLLSENTTETAALIGTSTIFEENFDDITNSGWWHTYASSGAKDEWATDSTGRAFDHTHSAHCGAQPGGSGSNYSNNDDSFLVSPYISLPATSDSIKLTFYQYIDTEISSSTQVYDGAEFYVESDDEPGTFYLTDPEGGYPYTFDDACAPPNIDNWPAWGGSSGGWQLVTVDLSSYKGKTIRLGFRFVSDCSTTQEGWYIDNIKIVARGIDCNNLPDPVEFFNATAKNGEVILEWVNPDITDYDKTVIRMSTTDYPESPTDGTAVTSQSGTAGNPDSYTVTGLTNGTTYYFSAFVYNTSGAYSVRKEIKATPVDNSDGVIQWVYNTSAASLTPPGYYPDYIFVAGNDRILHPIHIPDGLWPTNAKPFLTDGPIQSRPVIVERSSMLSVYVSSLDGRVYDVNGTNMSEIWHSDILATMLLASPTGMFTDFGGVIDAIFVGTRNSGNYNSIIALNPDTGSKIWEFNNGADTNISNSFGPISGSAYVDYLNKAIYFNSRSSALSSNNHLIYALNPTDGSPIWSSEFKGGDLSPTSEGKMIFTSDINGTIWAYDINGNELWLYFQNDGYVKSHIEKDWYDNLLFFSTSNYIYCLKYDETSAEEEFKITSIPNPSAPIVNGLTKKIYVGGGDGYLYEIDYSNISSPTIKSYRLSSSGLLGEPAIDIADSYLFIGSSAGEVFCVKIPLP